MEYRRLGRTGLDVSVIGPGTEYLNWRPRKTVVSVVHEAIEQGVNYIDLVFAFPEYRDNFGAALQGYRDKVILSGHVCTGETDGHYRLTRDVQENEGLFLDLLSRLHTDYVDLLFIQMVNSEESYETVTRPGGLMEMALRFKKEGKARFIGMSGHKPPAVLMAVQSGQVDVFMFPINLAWDFAPGRKEVLQACASHGVGLVAMKPFAGGRIFQKRRVGTATPVQCIHYVLSQPGVSTAVPGVKNSSQLREVLNYASATTEEKDFQSLVADLQQDIQGNCVYCNHCAPCPVGIDIGQTIRRLDTVRHKVSDNGQGHKALQAKVNFYYPGRIRTGSGHSRSRSAKPSACIECGVCMERCPFDVDVIAKMRQAVEWLVG